MGVAIHIGNWKSPTGGVNMRRHTQCTPISPMWHVIYSLSYHMVSEWRPVFPMGEMLLDVDSLKPLVRPFAKKS